MTGAALHATELVMRDLVDALIQENLFALAQRRQTEPPGPLSGEPLDPGEAWFRVDLEAGWICFRARPAAALQSWRFSRGPVWHGEVGGLAHVTPAELLEVLQASSDPTPSAEQVTDDLRAAVRHAE